MDDAKFITALCTPLTEAESIDVVGLETHIEDQLEHGIDSLLAGGTMGAMQLLTMDAYLQLAEQSVRIVDGRAELLLGVGDTSTATTLARIRAVEHLPVDGLVVLSPYFVKYGQAELVDFFTYLADNSAKPIFMYDLPRLTGVKLELESVRTLRRHPNIQGIKCSDHFAMTRPLLTPQDDFRVIVAQPTLLDVLLKSGVREHLDGVFGFAPNWIRDLQAALKREDWFTIAKIQEQFNELLAAMQSFDASIFASTSELLNLRGISGRMAPRPIRLMSEADRERFRALDIVQQSLANCAVRSQAGDC